MVAALLMLIGSALLCGALGVRPRTAALGRVAAVLGTGMALTLSLVLEGLQGSGAAIEWPKGMAWLGSAVFRSDALSAGLGAWCLLLGGLCLLRKVYRDVGDGRNAGQQATLGVLTIATLYSLVHLSDLLLFAGHVLFLTVLAWAYHSCQAVDGEEGASSRSVTTLGVGAIALLSAVLIIGRTTGGAYNLGELSLSSLTVWPLLLVAVFVVLWIGMTPFTGWGANWGGGQEVLAQSLVLGVPVLTLLLRFQALVTVQAVAGDGMGQWEGFTRGLAWAGGITALVAGARMTFWAYTPRWTALLTAHWLGMMLWAVSLDTPMGRYAAVAMFAVYGASRTALSLSRPAEAIAETQGTSTATAIRSRGVGITLLSLAALPLTAGFIGVWLLGAALLQEGHPSVVIALVAVSILGACGIALQAAALYRGGEARVRGIEWVGLVMGVAILVGGIAPALWLPEVGAISGIAGGSVGTKLSWVGAQGDNGSMPVALLAIGLAVMAVLGKLLLAWARLRAGAPSALLPTALERLGKMGDTLGTPDNWTEAALPVGLLRNSPLALWGVSLAWLEAGISRVGSLLYRANAGAGGLLGRLEGRFYLPLALILTLIALVAITR